MKSFINKFKYFILGGIVVMAGTVYAVQVSVPSSNGSGFLLQSGSNGLYTPVSLTAGTNVTISTTTSNITISSTGGGGTFPFTVNSWGNSTTSTLGFLNGFLSTASSTISAPLRLSSLSQGYTFVGSTGLVGTISTSTLASNLTSNCATITGGAGLCDGVDDVGGAGGGGADFTYLNDLGNGNGAIYSATTSPLFINRSEGLIVGNGSNTGTSTLNYNSLKFDQDGNILTLGQFVLFGDSDSPVSGLVSNSTGSGIIDPFSGFSAYLSPSSLSADRVLTFPDLAGVFAIGSYSTGFTEGNIPFGSSGLLATSSSLAFDGTRLNFAYASTTNGFSTPYASTTALHIGTGQGFLYTGSGQKVNAVASSSINLSWFNNDAGFITSYTSPYEIATTSGLSASQLSYFTQASGRTTLGGVSTTTLTASSPLSLSNPVVKVGGSNSVLSLDTSGSWTGSAGSVANALTAGTGLTSAGTYNGAVARTFSLDTANANTWTALQSFNYSSSTVYSSFLTASSTNWLGGGLQTCDPTTGKLTWSSGQFGCGTDQNTGGAGASSQASTTATIIMYKVGTNYYAYNSTTTVTTTNTNFSTLLQAQVDLFDDGAVSVDALCGSIHLKQGVYYANSSVTINGNNNGGSYDSGCVTISGEGREATKIVVATNTNWLDFDNAAMPQVRDLSIYVKGTGSAFVSDSVDNNARAVWDFDFSNISILATTTHTGYGFNLGNAFRGTFTNIEMFGLHNCAQFTAEGTFNPGDFTFQRSFCELDSASGAIAFRFATSTGATGFMNQVSFDMVEGIGTGASATMFYADALFYSNFRGINAEQFDVLFDLEYGSSNRVEFNYTVNRSGVANLRGCRFWAVYGGTAKNWCDFKFANSDANYTIVDDMNTWTDNPNGISGYIASDSGTVIASSSPGTVTLFRDITGYGTMDTNLSPGGRLGVWEFFGDLIAKGAASVVNFTNAIRMYIASGTGTTFDKAGQIYFDTTDNQFQIATSTANGARAIPTIIRLWSGTVASTSVDFVSGGRIPLASNRDGVVITEIRCQVDGGTSKAINLDTLAGGANTDSVTCATTETSDTSMSTNYSKSAGTTMALELGATTGSVDYVSFSVWGYVIAE